MSKPPLDSSEGSVGVRGLGEITRILEAVSELGIEVISDGVGLGGVGSILTFSGGMYTEGGVRKVMTGLGVDGAGGVGGASVVETDLFEPPCVL